MLLVLDRDNYLHVYDSVEQAERDLETIDVELGEYEFCDECGQPYIGDVLEPVETFRSGRFRIVPRGPRDPGLPAKFVSRARECSSRVSGMKSLADARARFCQDET